MQTRVLHAPILMQLTTYLLPTYFYFQFLVHMKYSLDEKHWRHDAVLATRLDGIYKHSIIDTATDEWCGRL